MPRRKKEIKVPEPKQKPNGKWYIQLRLKDADGKQQSHYILADTEAECRAKAIAEKAGITKTQKTKTAPTLGAVIDEYIAEMDGTLSPSTIKAYKSYREHRFQRYMSKPIDSIKWQSMISTEKEVNPKTIYNAWSLVSASVGFKTGDKPKVKLPKQIPNEHPFLTYQQIMIFKEQIKGKPFEIAALLGLNSLRFSEIKGLTWDKIDLEKKEITISAAMIKGENNELVYKKTMKNKSSNRVIPILYDELIEALSAVEDKTGYVVSLTEMQLYKAVNNVCKANGFPEVGCHGLRHSYASALFYMGIPTDFVQKWGGWIELETMKKIYTHVTDDHADQQAELIRQKFTEQNATKNATVSHET